MPISKVESHISDRCSHYTGWLFVSSPKLIWYSMIIALLFWFRFTDSWRAAAWIYTFYKSTLPFPLLTTVFSFLQPDGTELFHFVDGYPSWDAYLTSMMADGTWGDHVILHGAANCFRTCIHVISSLPHRYDVMVCPEFDVTGSNRLVLGHLHELHYVSLIPQIGGKDVWLYCDTRVTTLQY